MNTLSWLIYAAEALSSIKTATGALAVVSIIATGLVLIVCCVSGAIHIADNDASAGRFAQFMRGWCKLGAVVCLIATVIWAASPTPSTLYLIAASEAGETVVTSPDTIEMMGDLKAIIKKRIKQELGE